jgi:hypothetical protein
MIGIREIEEVRGVLASLAPYSAGLREHKRRLDLIDFAFADLKLFGSVLTREGVSNIFDGNMISGIPVREHRLVEAHRKLRNRFDDKAEMQMSTDSILLNEFAMILFGTDLPPYRASAPPLYHLDFVPGSPDEISRGLHDAFAALARMRFGGDCCLRAAAVHCGIVAVYPYEEGKSEMAARVCMQYELFRAGLFPVDLGVNEQTYNRALSDAVKKGDPSGFAEIVRIAVFKKLHYLIDAAKRGV